MLGDITRCHLHCSRAAGTTTATIKKTKKQIQQQQEQQLLKEVTKAAKALQAKLKKTYKITAATNTTTIATRDEKLQGVEAWQKTPVVCIVVAKPSQAKPAIESFDSLARQTNVAVATAIVAVISTIAATKPQKHFV